METLEKGLPKVCVSTKVPIDEKAEIEKRAEENGMNLSEYVSEGLWLEQMYLEHPFRLILTALRAMIF